MGLMDHLQPGEEVVARAGQFYATSRRVLRYDPSTGGKETLSEVPYNRVRSVELDRPPNHVYMASGTIMAASGLFLTLTIGWITPLLAIPLGLALIFLGASGTGKQQYFQLHTTGLTPKEEAVWRIQYIGSMDLITAIQERVAPRR